MEKKVPTTLPMPTDGSEAERRRALALLSEGFPLDAVAAEVTLQPSELRRMVRGVKGAHGVLGGLLREEGVTLARVAEVLAESLSANDWKWNRATEEWEPLPDQRTRLNAARTVTAVLDAYAPRDQTPAVHVQIVTNIDDRPQADEEQGHFVIDVPAGAGMEPEAEG